MPLIPIPSIDDPRVALYRNLKDRDLSREGERFMVEGELVVRRLLESDYPVESVLVAQRRAAAVAPVIPADVPVYVAEASVVNAVLGYRFHSGVMAVSRRKPAVSIDQLAAEWRADEPVTLVVCPEVSNTDNMGSLIRIAGAFGATGMVLGERCCDPFYRQSVRVSMGTIFRMPLVRSTDLTNDLRRLRERWGVQLIGTVCDGDAEPLAGASRPQRIGILFGNEAQGLSPEHVAACDRRVTIPMRLGTDSLNVSVAAGVVLYHFTQYASAGAAGVSRS